MGIFEGEVFDNGGECLIDEVFVRMAQRVCCNHASALGVRDCTLELRPLLDLERR